MDEVLTNQSGDGGNRKDFSHSPVLPKISGRTQGDAGRDWTVSVGRRRRETEHI